MLVVTEPVNSHRAATRAPDRANAPSQALARSELRIPRFSVSAEVAAALLQSTGRTAAEWQTAIDGAPSPSPSSMRLEGVQVRLRAANQDAAPRPSWNVAGLWAGSDPKLRDEYVLFSSHQDHDGERYTVNGDKIWNGADDNATTSVALRPSRSSHSARSASSPKASVTTELDKVMALHAMSARPARSLHVVTRAGAPPLPTERP